MRRVLIIGGGIAGLSTAIALQRLNIPYRVFERSSGPSEIGAGITLWSNAIMCLRALSVADAVIDAGTRVISGELRDWRGRVLMRTPVKEVCDAIGEPSIAIHRARLLDILTTAAGAETIAYNSRCTAIEQTSDSVVARFDDGRQESGDVLIGADGLRARAGRFAADIEDVCPGCQEAAGLCKCDLTPTPLVPPIFR